VGGDAGDASLDVDSSGATLTPQGGCVLAAGQPAMNRAGDDWGTGGSGGSSVSVAGGLATGVLAGGLATGVLAGGLATGVLAGGRRARAALCGSNWEMEKGGGVWGSSARCVGGGGGGGVATGPDGWPCARAEGSGCAWSEREGFSLP